MFGNKENKIKKLADKLDKLQREFKEDLVKLKHQFDQKVEKNHDDPKKVEQFEIDLKKKIQSYTVYYEHNIKKTKEELEKMGQKLVQQPDGTFKLVDSSKVEVQLQQAQQQVSQQLPPVNPIQQMPQPQQPQYQAPQPAPVLQPAFAQPMAEQQTNQAYRQPIYHQPIQEPQQLVQQRRPVQHTAQEVFPEMLNESAEEFERVQMPRIPSMPQAPQQLYREPTPETVQTREVAVKIVMQNNMIIDVNTDTSNLISLIDEIKSAMTEQIPFEIGNKVINGRNIMFLDIIV